MKVTVMPLFLEGTGLHKRNQTEARRIRRKTQDTTLSLGPTHFWSQVARVMWSPTTTFFHDSEMRGERREQTLQTLILGYICAFVYECWGGGRGGRCHTPEAVHEPAVKFSAHPYIMNISPLPPSHIFPQVIFCYQKRMHYMTTSYSCPHQSSLHTLAYVSLIQVPSAPWPLIRQRSVSPYVSSFLPPFWCPTALPTITVFQQHGPLLLNMQSSPQAPLPLHWLFPLPGMLFPQKSACSLPHCPRLLAQMSS